MAPPKARLHKNTGKLKSIPKPGTVRSNNNNVPPTPESSPVSADQQQFVMELYWCIQQLERSLTQPHVQENRRKTEETIKLINTLKSNSQPLIRKRQIMSTTFGDYRAQMAAEEETMRLNADSVHFEATQPNPKYHFVKKAAILSGDKDFRFNFDTLRLKDDDPVDNPSETVNNGKDVVAPTTTTNVANGPIMPSDNSFRFNFNV